MSFVETIKSQTAEALGRLYACSVQPAQVQVNETLPEFEGHYTVVTFALSKLTGKRPDELACELGEELLRSSSFFSAFQVIKGFLNLSIQPAQYIAFLQANHGLDHYGRKSLREQSVMVEYSSPNTNKPLHFGHLRNIFLGYSLSEILEETGHKVIRANLINDRGIHICKSMVAWQLTGEGATPESLGVKGDHLVGDFYVRYNDLYKAQVEELVQDGMDKEQAEKQAPILQQAQDMLRLWEAGDAATLALWRKMNAWVYEGFEVTYKKLGVRFDRMYYESDTYLLGRDLALAGLEKGILQRRADGSVWIDLSADGLDQKLLLRGDGTSVYMTQDLGTAVLKYRDYHMDRSVYVIGDEQNYHMQVLKLILQKLGEPCAEGIYHLSYGMVELPSGRMKSREGTVVDADDMIREMEEMARKNTEELGKVEGFAPEELNELYHTLGMGALKFYLLRVDPKKKMIFNPQESIDFHGFTGPFIQYTHARICSILRKADSNAWHGPVSDYTPDREEVLLLRQLEQYPSALVQAAEENNPSHLANFVYHVAKSYNGFLADHSVLKADADGARNFRLQLSALTRTVLRNGLRLLGITAPERM
jgi:arginyl-tRNA synthetase